MDMKLYADIVRDIKSVNKVNAYDTYYNIISEKYPRYVYLSYSASCILIVLFAFSSSSSSEKSRNNGELPSLKHNVFSSISVQSMSNSFRWFCLQHSWRNIEKYHQFMVSKESHSEFLARERNQNLWSVSELSKVYSLLQVACLFLNSFSISNRALRPKKSTFLCNCLWSDCRIRSISSIILVFQVY